MVNMTDATRSITKTEERVLALVAQGLKDAEVADELGKSVRTVHFHLANIYKRLNLRNRTEATLWHLQKCPSNATAGATPSIHKEQSKDTPGAGN